MKLVATALLAVAFPAFSQTAMSVDWDWKASHRCSTSSPPLAVTGIPADTKTLQVAMVDLQVTSYDHGGGSAAHTGGAAMTIPEGALKGYAGPCPPNYSSFGHDYEFTVRALGADGKELGRAVKAKTFSAKTVKP